MIGLEENLKNLPLFSHIIKGFILGYLTFLGILLSLIVISLILFYLFVQFSQTFVSFRDFTESRYKLNLRSALRFLRLKHLLGKGVALLPLLNFSLEHTNYYLVVAGDRIIPACVVSPGFSHLSFERDGRKSYLSFKSKHKFTLEFPNDIMIQVYRVLNSLPPYFKVFGTTYHPSLSRPVLIVPRFCKMPQNLGNFSVLNVKEFKALVNSYKNDAKNLEHDVISESIGEVFCRSFK